MYQFLTSLLGIWVVTLLGPVCWLICGASELVQECHILCSTQLVLEVLLMFCIYCTMLSIDDKYLYCDDTLSTW